MYESSAGWVLQTSLLSEISHYYYYYYYLIKNQKQKDKADFCNIILQPDFSRTLYETLCKKTLPVLIVSMCCLYVARWLLQDAPVFAVFTPL